MNSQCKVSVGASIAPNKPFNCPLGSNKLFPSLNTLNGLKVPAGKLVYNSCLLRSALRLWRKALSVAFRGVGLTLFPSLCSM